MTTTSEPLVINIRGLGHVPAFKNKKIIAGKRLITAPKARKWMKDCTRAIYSTLKYLYQTGDGATSTARWQQSAIASWPLDDNWKVIPKITVRVRVVPKGDEGAIIRITKLSPV